MAPAPIRKTTCKAYNSKCLKCSQVCHITKVCKKTVKKKTKEEQVTTNTVQIMHSTMSTADVNLCQLRVLGKEIEYKHAIRDQLRTRTNITLPNEENNKEDCFFTEDPSQC